MEKIYNEGAIKTITTPNEEGYIFKYFKKGHQLLSLEEQQKIIDTKKHYFGEYIPETILCSDGNGNYYIKQKFIKGKILKDINIEELPLQTLEHLLDLITRYLTYCKNENQIIDLTGYINYGKDISLNKRRLLNFCKIYDNFLSSTNIMISENGNVYMVDVCDGGDKRIIGKIKNFFAKPFIEYTKFSLLEIIKQRESNLTTKKSSFLKFLTTQSKEKLIDCLK